MLYRFIIWAMLTVALFSCEPAFAQDSGPINTGTLLKRLYGIDNAPQCNKNSFTVGTTAIKLLKNAAGRAAETWVNPSANQCEVWFDSTVSATNGIVLGPSGGNLIMDFRSDLTLPTYEMWGICSAAGTVLTEVDCNVQ